MRTERGRGSWRRMGLIAGATVREARRHRLLQLGVALAAAVVFAVRGLRELNFGASERVFIADFGLGAMGLLGALLAIGATVHAVFGELEPRAIGAILARPVSRTEFLGGKFAGVLMLLGGFCALLTGLTLALLTARGIELRLAGGMDEGSEAFSHGAVLIVGALQAVRLALIAAMTLLVCTLVRTPLLAIGVSVLWVLAAQLYPVAAGLQAQGAAGGWAFIVRAIGWLLPNFGVFEIADYAASRVGGAALRAGGYGVFFVALYAMLAAWRFRERDLPV